MAGGTAAIYWRARSIAFRAVESRQTGGCVGCSGGLEMLNPDIKSYGFEAARQRAEQLLAEQQRDKPQPTQPTWAPRLHGMARRAEQIELNRRSCAEAYARVLGPLRVHARQLSSP